jgi:hypothetical protein
MGCMRLLVGFHGEGTCVLRRPVPASWALGWTDQECRTMTRGEHHIRYRRSQHPDRGSSDLSAESMTWNLSKISRTHQSLAPAPGQVGRESDGHRQRYRCPQDPSEDLNK